MHVLYILASASAKSWPDQEIDKEYVSGVPVVSFKDPGSPRAPPPTTERQPMLIPHPLSPIKDVSESLIASRETTFNKTPVLPPIQREGQLTVMVSEKLSRKSLWRVIHFS